MSLPFSDVCKKLKRQWKRKLLVVIWTWTGLVTFTFVRSSHRLTFQMELQGIDIPSSEQQQKSPVCVFDSLPSSVRLHCLMYHKKIISGTLCAPLCEEGRICDVKDTYGNAHKEVKVTQCHGFCSEGQNVKAVLKHDEISACQNGYEVEYRQMSMNDDNVSNQTGDRGTTRRNYLRDLLRWHLPVEDVLSFPEPLLRQQSSEVDSGFATSSSRYNSLSLLYRQKEFVLFQAYGHKNIFPKVYGTCGPLYLVEYCDPLVSANIKGEGSSHTRLPLSTTGVTENMDYDVNEKSGSVMIDLLTSEDENYHLLDVFSRLFKSLYECFSWSQVNCTKTLKGKDAKAKNKNVYSSNVPITLKVEKKKEQSIQIVITDTNLKHQYLKFEPNDVVNMNVINIQRTNNPFLNWTQRAKIAVRILRFLQVLEDNNTFSESVHLCDPKLEHFALSRRDGGVRLIDADLLLFDNIRVKDTDFRGVDIGACAVDEDCSDVMCRGWCNKGTKRCGKMLTNNNLQGICEKVFLRPSLEYGAIFKDVPIDVHHNVTSALCHCATGETTDGGIAVKKPLDDVLDNLLDVLEHSIAKTENSANNKMDGAFLLESCRMTDY